MGSWLNFAFKPIVIDMSQCKYNIYRGSVTKECFAGVIGDNISKHPTPGNSLNNSQADRNQNFGNPIPLSPHSVEECKSENISDEDKASDDNVNLTNSPTFNKWELMLDQDKTSDNYADLTPPPSKVDKWERMLDQGLLALKLSIERDPDLTPPPDACIENWDGYASDQKQI
nr:uncharacterized protein LOC118682452 [Bactrocera oleae]